MENREPVGIYEAYSAIQPSHSGKIEYNKSKKPFLNSFKQPAEAPVVSFDIKELLEQRKSLKPSNSKPSRMGSGSNLISNSLSKMPISPRKDKRSVPTSTKASFSKPKILISPTAAASSARLPKTPKSRERSHESKYTLSSRHPDPRSELTSLLDKRPQT